jgi:osmotically-inducible protein OsmY
LAGIVSRADLVRALATQKPASEPEPEPGDREIRQEVLLVVRALKAVDRPDINVIVESGIVSVWGYIQNEERRVPIVEAIKNVPGVKAVEDHLATFPAWYWAE